MKRKSDEEGRRLGGRFSLGGLPLLNVKKHVFETNDNSVNWVELAGTF